MAAKLDFGQFPLFGSYDVVVCGGGPSGCVAAMAAARLGAKTLVVEQYGFLGGALTGQGVHPMMTFHAGERQVIQGIPDQVVQRLVEAGASPGHIADTIGYASSVTPFDAEGLKVVLEEMLAEDGVEVLYHAMLADAEMRGEEIRRILVCTKGGLQCIEGKVFVEATGDGDLMAYAGVDFVKGRGKDGAVQPMTTNFRVGNVDIDRIREYMLDNPEEFYMGDVRSVRESPRLSVSGFYGLVQKGREAGDFPTDRKGILFFETNSLGEVNVNTTHIFGKDATDPRQFSQAEREGRQQARVVFAFLRKWIPGFENAVYLSTGFQIGVRESRRLKGCYTLTQSDLIEDRPFEDGIVLAGYPVDIHPPTPEDAKAALGAAQEGHSIAQGNVYRIPYRSLISPKAANLIVTGRCLSAEHEALGAIRVTPIAMAIGQGAGSAAAMAAKEGCSLHDIDIEELKGILREHGAVVP